MIQPDPIAGEREVLLVPRRQWDERRIVELEAARGERGALAVQRSRARRDDPRRHRIGVDRHLRGFIPRREDDDDAGIVGGPGGLVDRLVGIEQPERRAPGVVRDTDLPVGAMREHVVVGRQDAEDEHRVPGAVADQVGPRSDAEDLTVGVVRRDDPGDVRAVAARGVAVVVRALVDRDDQRRRRHSGHRAVDDLHVMRDAPPEVGVRRIDPAVDDRHTHAGAVDTERLHLVRADRGVGGDRLELQPLVGVHVGRETPVHGVEKGRPRPSRQREWQVLEPLHAETKSSDRVQPGRVRHDTAERGNPVDRAVGIRGGGGQKGQPVSGPGGVRHALDAEAAH